MLTEIVKYLEKHNGVSESQEFYKWDQDYLDQLEELHLCAQVVVASSQDVLDIECLHSKTERRLAFPSIIMTARQDGVFPAPPTRGILLFICLIGRLLIYLSFIVWFYCLFLL